MKHLYHQSGIPVLSLFAILILGSCGIHSIAWDPPLKPEFHKKLALNSRLSIGEKISLKGYYGAEEFAIDQHGNIYCGVHKGEKDFSSGAILKIKPDGTVEEWMKTDRWITGMQFNSNGQLIAVMNGVGLVRINKDQSIDTLVSKTPEGRPILIGTGMKIASNGKIYFANISSTHKTSAKHFNKIILEMKPAGGVYCYDPNTDQTTTLSTGTYFGNGLELSADESYLLLSETSKYRILKYWIEGDRKGKWEVLMENLPGFPNNISRRENGNFWVGFTTKRNDQLDNIHPKPGLKKLVYSLPGFVQPKAEKFGMVLEISDAGQIVQALFDPSGQMVSEAGAVKELNGYLYLGGDIVFYVSKISLSPQDISAAAP